MNNDNGLIGFLQKKSLFQNDKEKTSKNSKSHSRSYQAKDQMKKISNNQMDSHRQQMYSSSLTSSRERNYQLNQPPTYQSDNNSKDTTYYNSSLVAQFNNKYQNIFKQPVGKPFNHFKQQPYSFSIIQKEKPVTAWEKASQYSIQFQSAKVEATQCLNILSAKLKAELTIVTGRIDEFRANIAKALTYELRHLKEKILIMVEEAFKQSQKGIKEYMRAQEDKLAGDLIELRQALQRQYVKIETMKQQIERPFWKKVAGQILSTDLQRNIAELLKKNSTLSVGRWQKKQWSDQHIMNLAKDLRDLVRFRQ